MAGLLNKALKSTDSPSNVGPNSQRFRGMKPNLLISFLLTFVIADFAEGKGPGPEGNNSQDE